MISLINYYKEKNIVDFEGFSQEITKQVHFLKNIVNNENIFNVMEIGFNAGHSADLFLSSNKNINLVSFDLGDHSYVKIGKEYIDKKFPNRHKLILGDSLITVPEYIKKNNNKFDIIFIDGGHEYKNAKGDLLNCKMLAHEKTIVIMDDTVKKKRRWDDTVKRNRYAIKHWNKGPNKAWMEGIRDNIIKELGSHDYEIGRGDSWGIYL